MCPPENALTYFITAQTARGTLLGVISWALVRIAGPISIVAISLYTAHGSVVCTVVRSPNEASMALELRS